MSINIYPEITHRLAQNPELDFGTEIDATCTEIHEACKGWGTDEKRLIKALASCDGEARTKVSLRYKELHGKELKALMKSECSGDFGTALQLLALPPDVAEAALIRMATKGLGTTEKILYPIICGRTNAEIDILKKAYFKTYGKDLGQLVGSETSGDLHKLFITCVQGVEEEFDPKYHTDEKAKEDAEAFYKAGQARWGTDEKEIFKIICLSPPQYVTMIDRAYADKHGYTLSKALEKELSGITEKGALFTLGMKIKPYETIAHLIKSACAGFGTDELLLTSCIIRYQPVWSKVALAHMELYGKSVPDRVKSETSRNYKKVLLEVLTTSWPAAAY
uniref:Annexin n=1 Tax=Odontella aurita TaxID=265563 RepID=A0A6U6HAY2_9STRA|mmetsp:Transcript_46325/g.140328  ORF Transcript_46325/g.140328 Transcript_46325/m.140328 type:complete len:335 (+) Transcript_46325:74-1078(+)